MSNIKLTVAYDGTAYHGWQKTAMGPSIEETLQQALEQILQQRIVLQAASRTDAGVHAQGQIVNFIVEKENVSLQRLKISLNCLLPKDLAILDIEQAEDTFHPTLDCTGKEYRYNVCYDTAQLPIHRFYSWHYPHPLNVSKMREAAQLIIGERDFSSFCNFKKNSTYQTYVRHVTSIEIVEEENKRLLFKISGNHFLYKMVRNIVGTLVYVGRGKIPLAELSQILENKDRTLAGMTAPAHGLTLHQVFYNLLVF